MRIAILSDIHGNRTAFEAVLADLRQTSPDLILHGGDLADSGSSPAEIVDRVRDLGWQGVVGNTDEMLFRPASLEEFASQSSAPPTLWTAIRQMAAATRTMLGEDRITWLSGLARARIQAPMALVHASPDSSWRAPTPEVTDAELESLYGLRSTRIFIVPTFGAFQAQRFKRGLSPTPEALVFRMTAIAVRHTCYWMGAVERSAASSMT